MGGYSRFSDAFSVGYVTGQIWSDDFSDDEKEVFNLQSANLPCMNNHCTDYTNYTHNLDYDINIEI